MRNISNKVALKPRSNIEYPDYVHFKMHESSGTSMAWSGLRNGDEISGALTLNAAPTWVDGGAKPPASNSTVYAISSDATLIEALSPPQEGGLIVLYAYKQAGRGSAGSNNRIINWGSTGSGGGYSILHVAGANTNIRASIRGNGSGTTTSATIVNNSPTGWQTVANYLKTTPGDMQTWSALNGNWAGAVSSSTDTSSLLSDVPSGYGVSVFCAHASGPATPTELFNNNASDDVVLADLFIIRDENGSIFDDMGSIVAEHAGHWREKLRALAV